MLLVRDPLIGLPHTTLPDGYALRELEVYE